MTSFSRSSSVRLGPLVDSGANRSSSRPAGQGVGIAPLIDAGRSFRKPRPEDQPGTSDDASGRRRGLPVSIPHGEMTVCLTFDVDAESGWLGQGVKFKDRLTTLSEGRYGVTRGLPRILALLGEFEITATFYVPGLTAELHPEVVPAILSAGHEIGHHGYRHCSSDGLSEQQQAEELDLATEVIRKASGIVPRGYRSPSWEMTPETFRICDESTNESVRSSMPFFFKSSSIFETSTAFDPV